MPDTSFASNWLPSDLSALITSFLSRPFQISNPLNYLVMNTTKGTATAARKVDPSSFFNSLSLAVFSPSREVYQTITEAFVQAGLAESASNFYPLSAQTIRLHDRSKPFEWNYPDRLSVLCRVSYFEDKGLYSSDSP
jgi:hypothetical protein